MEVFCGTQAELMPDYYAKLLSYRHQVFIERLGWELDSIDGLERDQFDRPDTVYVVSRDENGTVTGCARLLPTTQPYLLGDVFPQLLNGQIPRHLLMSGNYLVLLRWILIRTPPLL